MLAPCLHSLVHLKHQAVEQSVGHGRKEPAALVALRQQELWGLENKDGQLMNWVESFLFIYFFIFILQGYLEIFVRKLVTHSLFCLKIPLTVSQGTFSRFLKMQMQNEEGLHC